MHLLGHALGQAVALAAQVLDTSAVAADADLTLRGHRSLQAALALAWGEPRARAQALGWGLEEVGRWPRWREPQHPRAPQAPPLQEVMETSAQLLPQDTDPAPDGEPGGRRLTAHVAPDRRISIDAKAIRHGRTSSAPPCNGFQEPCAVALASQVTREVVVRPAKEPEHAGVEVLAEEVEKALGLLQRAVALGYRVSPRMAPWAEQGVSMIARPWPPSGPFFPKHDSQWTLRGCRGPVRGASASRWSQAGMPRFRRRAIHAPGALSVPKPRSGKGET